MLSTTCLVGWGSRIRRLHLCRGVRPPPNETTCWPWLVTRKALGRNPGGWAAIDLATEWSMAYNTLLWPLLGLTGGRIEPDPINRLVQTCHSTYVCFFSQSYYTICSCGTIRSALVETFPTLYFIYARRRGWGSIVLRVRTLNHC